MPFKSESQRRKFHAMADRGEISKGKVKEWEDKTKNKEDLPMHVSHEKKSEFYEVGVKLAMEEAGLLEKDAAPAPATFAEKLRELAANPRAQRVAAGSAIGGTAASLTGDPQENKMLRALKGGFLGGVVGDIAPSAIDKIKGIASKAEASGAAAASKLKNMKQRAKG